MNKKILILTSANLENLQGGTPIRIYNFVEQLEKFFFITTVNTNNEKKTQSKFKLFLNLRKLIYQNKIEWIFTPTFSDVKMALLLKFTTHAKLAIDVHGLGYAENYYFGRISKIRKIFEQLHERIYIKLADEVFFVSQKMKQHYKVTSYDKGVVIYGGVSLDEFPNLSSCIVDTKGYFKITYTGNARQYQGVENLLQTLAILKNQNPLFKLQLVLSSDEEKVSAMVSEMDLENHVNIYSKIDHAKVSKLLQDTDLLVIPRESTDVTEYAFPTKLTEYLATGIPVLTTRVGPVDELVSLGLKCYITKTNDPEEMAKAILKIESLSLNERKMIGLEGRLFTEKYLTWDCMGEILKASFSERGA